MLVQIFSGVSGLGDALGTTVLFSLGILFYIYYTCIGYVVALIGRTVYKAATGL